MNLTGIAILNGYSILLLAVLLFYSLGGAYGRSRQRGLYVALLTTTMALMVIDTLARCDGFLTPAFPSINWWGNCFCSCSRRSSRPSGSNTSTFRSAATKKSPPACTSPSSCSTPRTALW